LSPIGAWVVDPKNPVVRSGELWSRICSGNGKHCDVGTAHESTPQIIEKRADGLFLVSFQGYDVKLKRGVRGVALTPDFATWFTEGRGRCDIFKRGLHEMEY